MKLPKDTAFFSMATSDDIKFFLNEELWLPHLWWGKEIAKDCYPNDWQKGHSVVVLEKYVPATNSCEETLAFTADDGEEYYIIRSDLKHYFKQKRFPGISMRVLNFVSLLFCFHVWQITKS